MADSAINKELIQYFTRLNEEQKSSLLEVIKNLLEPGKESGERITIEQYNKALDEAMERISRGESTTIDYFEREIYTTWFK